MVRQASMQRPEKTRDKPLYEVNWRIDMNQKIKSDIKLVVRYAVLIFFMYLAYDITRAGYANSIKDVGEIAVSAIYGSVFGALTMVIRGHFETKPDNN